MKIIDKIVRRGLKASRLKNIFVILTITLATCMMMFIGLYLMGEVEKRDTQLARRFQGIYLKVNKEQIEALKKEPVIEKAGVKKEAGKLTGKKYTFNLSYMDQNLLELYQSAGLEGKIPVKSNEIAVPKQYLDTLGKDIKIGDTVILGEGKERSEFVLSGVLLDEGNGKNFTGIVSDQYAKSVTGVDDTYTVYIRIKGAKEMDQSELKEQINQAGEKIQCAPGDIILSNFYFTLIGMSTSTQQGTILVTYLLIMATCSLVIYNIFYISVTAKLNEYGRLRTIGADKKQIKKIIRKEANVLSILAIPLGIILGSLLVYLKMPEGFRISTTVFFAVLVSVCAYLMVRFATARPGKIAALVSPVMAVGQTGYEGGKAIAKRKHRRLHPLNLAYINIMRHKKKVILTIGSLGLCGVLLMTTAAYAESIDPMEMARESEIQFGEFKIELSEEGITPADSLEQKVQKTHVLREKECFNDQFLKQVKAIKGVKAIKVYQGGEVSGILGKGESHIYGFEIVNKQDFEDMKPNMIENYPNYLDLVEGNGIVIGSGLWESGYGEVKPKLGEKMTVTDMDGNQKEFKIVGFVDSDYKKGANSIFMIGKPGFLEYGSDKSRYAVDIKTDASLHQSVKENLEKLIENNSSLSLSVLEEKAIFYKTGLAKQLKPIYILVFFIGIFGVLNMMNTLFTSMISRKRELSVLQTVGLSNQQLRQMLIGEGIFYFIGVSIVTTILGAGAGIILCNVLQQLAMSVFGRINYQFPVVHLAVYLLIMLLALVGCSVLSIVYYQKESLVERMRSVN